MKVRLSKWNKYIIKKIIKIKKMFTGKVMGLNSWICDFIAFHLVKRVSMKFEVLLPRKSLIYKRIYTYRLGYHERIKPKKSRAKTRLREDFQKKGVYPKPESILREFGALSQGNLDTIILELISKLHLSDSEKFSIEIGSGHQGGNSSILTFMNGFRSLWIDGDPLLCEIAKKSYKHCNLIVLNEWVTKDNITQMINEADFGSPAFIGIDIDGNDYFVFREILELNPKIICVEYNPVFGSQLSVSIRYQPMFNRKIRDSSNRFIEPKGLYGASLMAFYNLAVKFNYSLVAVSNLGSNLVFIQSQLLPKVPRLTPSEAYQLPKKENLKRVIQSQVDMGFENWLGQFSEKLCYPD